MISGQKSLRFFALLTWIICVFYTSSFISTNGFLFALIAAGSLTIALIVIAESKKIPIYWRACVFMILVLFYTFRMAYYEGVILSAPLVIALVTVSTGTFLNKKVLHTVCIVWNLLLFGTLLFFPDVAFKIIQPSEYVYTFMLAESAWLFVYLFITWFQKQIKYAEDLAAHAHAAYRSKGDFLASMSHEIRTPMNAIVGMSELIISAGDSISVREIQQNSMHIRSASLTLINLINDVMESARIEGNDIEILPTQYGTRSMLYDVVEVIAVRLEEKPIQLVTDFRIEETPELIGDEPRIKQVLYNLLSNAVKYTMQGQITLTVETTLIGNSVMLNIEVADTGLGIRKEDLDMLFKEYQQFDQEQNKHVQGTGLGLTITKRLVNAMGGEISVTSEHGQGSAFRVHIPQELPNKHMADSLGSDSLLRPSAPKADILLVDDNQVNLTVTTGLFKLYDIICDTALSGREAIRKCQQRRYDIIYMDHMMPEMDGIEVTQALRSMGIPWLERVPIIALSANAIAGMKQTFLASGMDAFIAKPVMLPEIEESLQRFLPEYLVRMVEKVESAMPVSQAALPPMEGIDIAQGISYCGGTVENYLEVLRTYKFSAPNQIRIMRNALENGDIARVALEAHALKSASKGIGALPLSELAFSMEKEGKQGNVEYVSRELEPLLSAYQQILETISPLLQGEKSTDDAASKPPISKDTLVETLQNVHNVTENYDLEAASDLLAGLDAYALEETTQAAIDSIKGAILVFSYTNTLTETQLLLDQLK